MLKKTFLFILSLFALMFAAKAQTPLTYAPNFTVKTIKSEMIELYADLLDQDKIVVLDFFSVSCGPCQTYAHDFQLAYEAFGENSSNVFFLGVNYNGTVDEVIYFDSVYNITLPSCSGLEGGGNVAFETFQVSAYPTVVVIQPDRTITHQWIWEPSASNIIDAVIEAGGLFVGLPQNETHPAEIELFPQPAASAFHFRVPLETPQTIRYWVKDLNGRTLLSRNCEAKPVSGYFTESIDLKSVSPGTYILELNIGKKVIRKKILKINDI
ncbi:MAG: redoxin domain-containing protein [Bacteroidales bacterium]|nr:redoxin domain-containing protein [Bacteroidales bacterium]